MKNCTDLNNIYDDVLFCPGEKTLPGVRDHFYFMRKKDIVEFGTVLGNKATALDKSVEMTVFTLAADAKWNRVDLVPNESEVTVERAGTFGSYHFNNKATLVLPGTGKAVTGLISEMVGDDIVVVVVLRDGLYRVFGNDMFTVQVNPSQALGKGADDANTTTIEIEVEDLYPAPFFSGPLETRSGILTEEKATAG